ncbi:breast cancer anti-estrogen resistance protein 3 homolog isoform X2 [Uranotaenia lowii]|uniref:breast cancer anti-estrogen resistance protein 3 homolog isoform X2 n=1 Tax=Uranotaenia lowii TaxID=190385 RepID=UPI002479E418|nr:breast cancer anti-estrogen resistance protein 3 homolog isoform X2 [Uranotaenia lowii]
MGKSTSKLDKRRSQSISWSHKFGSLNRRRRHDPTMVITSCPHLEVRDWLKRLNLEDCYDKFKQFNGVEDFLYYSEADIKKLGIRNNAHRARIVSSLVALREKPSTGSLHRSETLKKSMRHSMAADMAKKSATGNEDAATYECLTVGKTKQSKSLGDLLEMESPQDGGGGGGGSGTGNGGGNEAVALKKALEWELSLDSRDLRSHGWYHGPIPRQRAEEIVTREGDFLVRDCVSQPGNYVLTCRTKGQTLHFVINKLLIQPETVYERVQYQFEDDAYDTVPDLITFYVGSGQAISAASGARIQFPCNRIYPLSFYASKYGQYQQGMRGPNSPSPVPSSPGFRYNPYTQQTNTYRSPMSSPPRTKRETPPRLPSKKQRSQSLTPLHGAQNTQQRYCSADGVIQSNGSSPPDSKTLPKPTRLAGSTEKCNSADGVIHQDSSARSTPAVDEKCSSADGVVKTQNLNRSISQSLPRSNSLRSSHGIMGSRASSINKEPSEHSLSPCMEQKHFAEDDEETEQVPSPPPKPIRGVNRNDSMKESDRNGAIHRMGSYHPSGSDSGNGSGDSAQSSATGEDIAPQHRGGVILKNPRFIPNSMSSVTLRSYVDFDPLAAEEALLSMPIPTYEQVSRYDLENFNTLMLPFCDYKPLDSGTLNTFRMMLAETGARVIASHLTRVDISLILDHFTHTDQESGEKKDNLLNCSGLELITLDHGRQFRLDLIERTECMKLLVAVTILTCPDDLERAETLNKWIQIAVETKTALGNLFGFCAIMLGLSMPQIQKLETTWHTLRQKYTDSAFNFEAKLRPTLNSMNDCSNPQAPNTTIPHVLPYILIKDRSINDILGDPTQPPPSNCTLVASCVTPWENITQDFGFSILFAHLDAARSFIKNLPLYRKNANIVMQDTSRLDALLEDAFRTEFQIKFLWGSKGCFVPAEDRHAKFEHVLTVMADKFCSDPSQNAAG